MIWSWKKPPRTVDDMDEARQARESAEAALAAANRQDRAVTKLTTRIIERREQNHFGDSLSITFTRKGASHG